MLKIMIVKAHFLSQWKAFMKELRVNPHILLLTSHDFDLFKVMSDLQTQGNQQWEQPPFTWRFPGSSQGREGSFRLFSSVTGPGLLHLLVIPTWRTRKHIIKNKNPFLFFGTFFSSPLIYSLRKWPWLVEWMNEWKKKKEGPGNQQRLKKRQLHGMYISKSSMQATGHLTLRGIYYKDLGAYKSLEGLEVVDPLDFLTSCDLRSGSYPYRHCFCFCSFLGPPWWLRW